MANILANYLATQEEMRMKVINNELPMESVVEFQEVNYRVDVLESCRALTLTAPVTTDRKKMGYHYQLTEKLLGALLSEHQIGPSVSDEDKKKRETALYTVERVIHDGRKKFCSFKATTQELYKETVTKYIGSVINVWIQYRNTFINI